jgi:voltage-gated potassium channel
MKRAARRFALIVLAMLVMLASGTAGFVLIEGYPVFDAFYMTLITVATVGYSEVRPLTPAGRVFNSAVILFGVTLLFFAIGVMAQTIVEIQFEDYFGKRRFKRMIEKLHDHYIVCGFGRVGRGAASELKQASVPFVVVDRNEDRTEAAIRAGMTAVQADATRDETLREVGVARARGLVAALATDADNLFVILSAKTMNQNLTVAARVAEEDAERKLQRAGADIVFAPYTHAGHQLAQALLRPHVFQFLDFTTKGMGLDVAMEQVKVADSSEFAAKTLQQVQIRRDTGVIVLAIRRASGEMLFNPPADAAIGGGDYLIVMGRPEGLRKLETLAGVRA